MFAPAYCVNSSCLLYGKIELFELQGLVASALEDMYELDPSAARLDGADNFFAVQEYRKACARFSIGAWRDAVSGSHEQQIAIFIKDGK